MCPRGFRCGVLVLREHLDEPQRLSPPPTLGFPQAGEDTKKHRTTKSSLAAGEMEGSGVGISVWLLHLYIALVRFMVQQTWYVYMYIYIYIYIHMYIYIHTYV